MTETPADKKKPDVPAKVFDEFLKSLEDAKMQEDLIIRLRKTLQEGKSFKEDSLRQALFGEEQAL